jgi:hypothetical protein
MYGVAPPVAANVPGYAVPTVPLGKDVVLTLGLDAAAAIVIIKLGESAVLLFASVTVNT